MEALEAVLDLVKERDEIAHDLEKYEDWFESLVGKTVTLAIKNKRKTRFVECAVTEFTDGEGWELVCAQTDEVYMITFEDFVTGRVYVHENRVSNKA